jgi:hypothetical protein
MSLTSTLASQVRYKLVAAAAAVRSLLSKLADTVSVKDFGAVGDGVADDTAAIQAAIDFVEVSGGDLYFPAGKYKITAQLIVSSLYPVNLIGATYGQFWTPATPGSALIPGANITGSMILYTAPNSGVRANHGGGNVRNLAFIDITGVGSTVGTRTMTAALELNDFVTSSVQNCVFQWINGSAIKGEFVVMSTVADSIIRYCGAVGKPACYFPSTDAAKPAQSFKFHGNRVEVCNDASYVSFGANSINCRLWGNGFEADTASAPSNQEFLTVAGTGFSITGNSFNRNTGSQMTVSGTGNAISGNVFAGGAFASTAITLSGARNSMTGNVHRSSRTGFEVLLSGRSNSYCANQLFASGAIKVTAASCKVDVNSLDQMTATSAVLGVGNEWWISLESTATASSANLNTLNNNTGTVTDVGGIRAVCTAPQVHSNNFNGFGATPTCLRIETGNASVVGNTEANCTNFITASTIGSSEYRANYPVSSTTVIPLQGSATWDPPSIAAAGTSTTTIAVTGAVVGDYVRCSFSLSLGGLVLSGYVSGANTVTAVLSNPTAGAIDLASGTVKAIVEKR